uniref:Uncharacterized protein n=1 Tax=Clytia hemisphaerica TaxID=252671 RepID=A0A7M5WS30_9CNID
MENKQLYTATKNHLKAMEAQVHNNVPSLSGYYNKHFIDQFEYEQVCKSKYDNLHLEELCLNCGHQFEATKMRLKLRRKKRRDKNTHRKIGITCLYCEFTTIKNSHLLKNKVKDVCPEKRDICNLTPRMELKTKPVQTPKLNMLQALQSKSNSSTPNTSFSKTPESSPKNNSRKKNRGKSFSPLLSMEQKQAKKTPDKPSLLSFLTSL